MTTTIHTRKRVVKREYGNPEGFPDVNLRFLAMESAINALINDLNNSLHAPTHTNFLTDNELTRGRNLARPINSD